MKISAVTMETSSFYGSPANTLPPPTIDSFPPASKSFQLIRFLFLTIPTIYSEQKTEE